MIRATLAGDCDTLMNVFYASLDIPLGTIYVVCTQKGIRRILLPQNASSQNTTHNIFSFQIQDALAKYFPETEYIEEKGMMPQFGMCSQAIEELRQYFAGERQEFRCPVIPKGTPFQQQVWEIVQAIPYGETRTYGDIAEALGDKNLSRAVGLANNANPIPIIIPCHRVIGKDGRLVGYGGGLAMKQYLLKLEGALLL